MLIAYVPVWPRLTQLNRLRTISTRGAARPSINPGIVRAPILSRFVPGVPVAAEPLVGPLLRNPYFLAGVGLLVIARLLWGLLNQRGERVRGQRIPGIRPLLPAKEVSVFKTRTIKYNSTTICGSDPPQQFQAGGEESSSESYVATLSSVEFGLSSADVAYACGSPYHSDPVGPQDGYAFVAKDIYGAVIDATVSPKGAVVTNDTHYASPYSSTEVEIVIHDMSGNELFPYPVEVDTSFQVPELPEITPLIAPPEFLPEPLPLPLVAPPEFVPLVQPTPAPLPRFAPLPGQVPAPSTRPSVSPSIRPAPAPLPVPGRVPSINPDGSPAPVTPPTPLPGQVTSPSGLPVPQTPPDAHVVGDLVIPSNPPPATPGGIATALGLIEAKAALALAGGPAAGGLWAALGKLQDLLDFLNSFYGPGQYELQPPCGTKPNGDPLDPAVAAWPGGRGSDSLVQSKLDAIAQLLQYHKDQRQPICKGAPPIGSEVTVNFVEVP